MEKYCPFNLTIQQVNEYVYDHNDNGDMVAYTHKLLENQAPTKCKKKACGAWRFGHCTRKA